MIAQAFVDIKCTQAEIYILKLDKVEKAIFQNGMVHLQINQSNRALESSIEENLNAYNQRTNNACAAYK